MKNKVYHTIGTIQKPILK